MSEELQREKMNNIHDDIKEIKTQVIKTNGRVSNLENWRNFITGGLAVLTILILPILFLVAAKLLN